MRNTFSTEAWRIAKYILIAVAINTVFTVLQQPLLNAAMAAEQPGRAMTLLSYGRIALSTVVGCLIHRYFTFRASEPWFIALPLMIVFAAGWRLVNGICLQVLGRVSVENIVQSSYLLGLIHLVLAYLFQRYVIYCHTTDDGGWYRRFHSTTEEEGAHPDE